jgi:hypothetical protein
VPGAEVWPAQGLVHVDARGLDDGILAAEQDQRVADPGTGRFRRDRLLGAGLSTARPRQTGDRTPQTDEQQRSNQCCQAISFAPAAPEAVRMRAGVSGCGDMSHG